MITYKRVVFDSDNEEEEKNYIKQAKKEMKETPAWYEPAKNKSVSRQHFHVYMKWDTAGNCPVFKKNGKPIIKVFSDEFILDLLASQLMLVTEP